MLQEEEEPPKEGEYFTTPEGLSHLTVEGKAVLEHLEKVFILPNQDEFSKIVAGMGPTHYNHINLIRTYLVSLLLVEEEGQFEDAD